MGIPKSKALFGYSISNPSAVVGPPGMSATIRLEIQKAIKAALDATVLYLAKSFSKESQVRFNAVCSGPLKTSASAGIPGYIDNYLYAEALTMRNQALETQEVANSVVFLLSSASSGINASGLLIDAGMSANYFDESVVSAYAKRTDS
jgi:enoyl-[acyl-carrier protein] reductase I